MAFVIVALMAFMVSVAFVILPRARRAIRILELTFTAYLGVSNGEALPARVMLYLESRQYRLTIRSK
jgi:hypothetical protein